MSTKRTLMPVLIVLALFTAACGGWYENTKATILTADDAVRAYDSIAATTFSDAPDDDESFSKLEKSMCFTYSFLDLEITAWSIAAMVDAGIRKESDFTMWVGSALSLVETAIDEWQIWDDPPTMIVGLRTLLSHYNPGEMKMPGWKPPTELECKDIVKNKVDNDEER